jgi:LmbE family N-acetylglucosaminyl deacetylase/glycosyltransferase involved in cell wall biosynthesis
MTNSLPGRIEAVHAASTLIVAPHYDDEVLGCGGLAASLTAEGGLVRVLFLTDGGGGGEEIGGPIGEQAGSQIGDRVAYRERRRGEAERVAALLGFSGCDALGLPDGALDRHLEAAAQGIRRALLSQRPRLLLVPSPLEVTRDHQAAFAALHAVLAPLREGSPEAEALAGLSVLAYEVNRPAYPDLLVDVSERQEQLTAAMAIYASQEERHPYLNAALGLRRFRTLSLGPEVQLAEGYRRLGVADFTTRSPAQLVRHLGGLPEIHAVHEGPSISVVVRTRDRPRLLAEALASLAAGSYRRAEVIVVNDGGETPELAADLPWKVVRVDLPENVGRAGAAQAGVDAATGDYVAFLDDDDLALPEHLATLAGLVDGTGVRVAYTDAAVAIYELDPERGWHCVERRLPYSRDFDPDVLLVDNYIPFNTLLIERRLLAEAGPFDRSLPFFEDWDLLIRLAALAPFHHLARVTCEYRHFRDRGDHVFGERPGGRADFLEVKARVLAKHAERLRPEALARAVGRLRGEAVDLRERWAAAQREAERLGRAHEEAARERDRNASRYHAANGEVAALRDESAALRQALSTVQAEAQRLYGEDAALRAAIASQTDHLTKTYAEIERLNALIRAMEGTRAWRLHRWWSRSGG